MKTTTIVYRYGWATSLSRKQIVADSNSHRYSPNGAKKPDPLIRPGEAGGRPPKKSQLRRTSTQLAWTFHSSRAGRVRDPIQPRPRITDRSLGRSASR